MKRNGTLVIAASALVTCFVVQSKRQPTYGGRTAKSWLEQVFDAKGNQRQAIDALRELGAKAVPVEIDALARTDSPLNKWYQSVYPKRPLSLQRHLPKPINAEAMRSAAEVRKAARMALEKIDPEAEAKPGGTAHGQDH